jgi:Tfp pilus assembly major pilin PilA
MKRQRGVTFVGMVIIAGLIVFAAIIGLKLVPAYIEYATVVNHLREIARSPEARGASPRDIQTMFNKRAQIDSINVVTGNDIEVEKDGDKVVLRANYSTKIKLFGNLSACIDFAASSGN